MVAILKMFHPKVLLCIGLMLTISLMSLGQIINPDWIIEWNPGVQTDPETEDGIPVYPIGVNVKNFGAKGDGITDESDAIIAAINACPEYHAVFFPRGKYRISRTIVISKPIVIRGELESSNGLSGTLIYNEDIGFIFSSGYNLATSRDIIEGFAKNSDHVKIDDASGFQVGDHILTDQLNDGIFVSNVGVGGASTWSSRENGSRCLGQMNRIKEINGNTLYLEIPLYHSYSDTLKPQLLKISGMLENAGIEDMHINGLYSSGSSNISMAGVSRCWIKNIHSENADRTHFSILRGFEIEVINNYLHHSRTGYGSMSYGVEFLLQSTASLVENNIFYHVHSAMMIAGGLTGSVFAYNYVTEIRNIQEHTLGIDAGFHGGHPSMILMEGNVFHKFVCDSYWGSNAHITLLRNHIKGHAEGTTTANIAVDIQAGNKYVNVIGNILGTDHFNGNYECIDVSAPYWNTWTIYKLGYNSFGDGDPKDNDPEVPETLLRHGNYDYVSDSLIWDPKIPLHDIPLSLYLSSKPAFFGEQTWPPVHPELSEPNMSDDLPAKVRFDSIIALDKESPSTPPDFEIVKVSGRTATLNWSFTEDNIAMSSYDIYRDGTKMHSTIYEGTWMDKTLENNSVYSYTIRARDYAGNDDNESDPIGITTLGPQTFRLTVHKGSGSGVYEEGSSVSIEANDRQAEGYSFSQWIGNSDFLSTAWNSSSIAELWDSVEVGATYVKVSGTDLEAPSAPHSFRVLHASETSVQLAWSIPDDDAGVYYFSLSYGDETMIDSWTQELGYIDTGLLPGTTYTYKLTASDRAGNTSLPATLSVNTPSGQDTEAPLAPDNLVASVISDSQINLGWDEAFDNTGISGYRVFRDDQNIAGVQTLFFSDSGLHAETAYQYYVLAVDAAGNISNPSNIVAATTFPDTSMTDLHRFVEKKVIVYPNPSSEYIHIMGPPAYSLSLYNLNGRRLLETDSNTIDLSGFSEGVYIVEIAFKDGSLYHRKVLVQ